MNAISSSDTVELPSGVVVALLRKEILLTTAKLHRRLFDQAEGERCLLQLQIQTNQVNLN